jgi:sucrose phosphorylase
MNLGTMENVKEISKNNYLMYDFMVNHISRQSEFFKDFEEKKDESKYGDFFIRYKDFWENGEPTEEEVDAIYKRKPKAPYYEVEFKDGTKENVVHLENKCDLTWIQSGKNLLKTNIWCKNGTCYSIDARLCVKAAELFVSFRPEKDYFEIKI